VPSCMSLQGQRCNGAFLSHCHSTLLPVKMVSGASQDQQELSQIGTKSSPQILRIPQLQQETADWMWEYFVKSVESEPRCMTCSQVNGIGRDTVIC
jgi:hypothetical protein